MRMRDFEKGLKVESELKNGFHVVPCDLDNKTIEKHISMYSSIIWIRVRYLEGAQAYIEFMEKGKNEPAYDAITYYSIKSGLRQKNKNWKNIVKQSEFLTNEICLNIYQNR